MLHLRQECCISTSLLPRSLNSIFPQILFKRKVKSVIMVNQTCDLMGCTEDVPLVEVMHLVFTRMPGESYGRQLRSLLLCLCYVFRAPVNSLVR